MTDQSTNVFDQQSSASDQGQTKTPDVQSLFADQLQQIKNEKGEPKYASVEEALKGAANAQEFIKTLKAEQEQVKRELEEFKSKQNMFQGFEQQLAELKALQQSAQKGESTTVPSTQTMNEDALAALVQKQLQLAKEQESKSKQQELALLNEVEVSNALSAKYGDKAGEVLKAKAQELGLSVTDLQQQARNAPKLVLALFGNNVATKSVHTSSYNLGGKPTSVEVPKPERSLLAGATSKQQADYIKALRQQVYQKHGISQQD